MTACLKKSNFDLASEAYGEVSRAGGSGTGQTRGWAGSMAGVKEVGGKEKPALAPRQRGGKGGTCRRGDDTEKSVCGVVWW